MSRAGRPGIGRPINVRLGDELLVTIDATASRLHISRAEAIRRALVVHFGHDHKQRA